MPDLIHCKVISIFTLIVADGKCAKLNSDHDDMVTDAQKIVIKELTGVEPTEEARKNIFQSILFW